MNDYRLTINEDENDDENENHYLEAIGNWLLALNPKH